jgi:2-iminobutanoate/2-iminopropanoate deaminase
VNGDIPEATRNALEGIRARVEEVGATMADIVQCTVFLTDIENYQEMNEAYVEYFPSEPPARTTIAAVAVPASAQMEIACIAVIP